MKVRSSVTTIRVEPGQTAHIPLEVINTSDVIESVQVDVLGIDSAVISAHPQNLPLFPDAAGEITVELTVPAAFPAGTYPLTLVVAGVDRRTRSGHHNLELTVPRQPALRLTASPSIVRARRKASFPVEVHNDGNVPLETALRPVGADRQVATQVLPSTVTVPPGGTTQATVVIRGPRHAIGADRERAVTIHGEAVDAETELRLVLQQRSAISRGLLTVLALIAIMAIWVLAFIFGIRFVLGGDPYAKVAPASFFAGQSTGADGDDAPGRAPDGALPKEGAVPAAVGATISGTVASAWDGEGVARLTVDVLRQGREGLILVSSTATLADGTYSVAGLFPGRYLVRVSGVGYTDVWHPAAAGVNSAQQIAATSQEETSGVDVAIVGDPATLRGRVLMGTAALDTPVTVTAQPTWTAEQTPQPQTTTVNSDGEYSFTGLTAPARYQLSFSAEGFRTETSNERVLGGQDRYALDVTLGSSSGSISGIVTDGTDPIGAVTVTTTVDDESRTVGTPTVGMVGRFAFPNLPTPATYVLTFSKEGFTTRSTVVDLEAGQSLDDMEVQLVGGAGTVTGKVTGPGGVGIGDATVTVGGSSAPLTTSTLTGTSAGEFTLTGLTIPGQYTITFSADGYLPASLPVTLTTDSPSAQVPARLARALGSVRGRVTVSGGGRAGIQVQITDGEAIRVTTSTATGDFDRGTYAFDDIPAGTYTVTARTDSGRIVATRVVTLSAGGTRRADLPISEEV